MTLHLIKLAVGIDDVEHLVERQRTRRNARGNCFHRTRMMPARAAELMDGGSLYWVIKGLIQVRQPILGVERGEDENGRSVCVIELAPVHVLVQVTAQRAFQGWRYLKAEATPPDLKGTRGKTYVDPKMPKALRLELARLGLL